MIPFDARSAVLNPPTNAPVDALKASIVVPLPARTTREPASRPSETPAVEVAMNPESGIVSVALPVKASKRISEFEVGSYP